MPPTRIPGSAGRPRDLVRWPDSRLREPAAPVTDFGAELDSLIEDMFATMYVADGVGLAACQIGVPLRVFVYDCPDDEDVRHLGHVVNPVLVETSGPTVAGEEGCLSVPGVRAQTPRFDQAVVRGQSSAGSPLEITGTGFFARCLQHETDHLEGEIFTSRLTGLRAWRAQRRLARL